MSSTTENKRDNISQAEANAAPVVFSNTLEVWRFLKAQGYKISKSLVYKHRDEGLLKEDKGNMYSLKGVLRYAKRARLKKDPKAMGVISANDDAQALMALEEIQRERELVELRIKKLKEKELARKVELFEGNWIRKEDFERELVARAVALGTKVRQEVLVRAPELILIVGGDQARSREFIAAFDDIWEAALSEYAKMGSYLVIDPDGAAANACMEDLGHADGRIKDNGQDIEQDREHEERGRSFENICKKQDPGNDK